MTALAGGNNDRTVLLLLPSEKELYPMSTAALARAQTSRRKLRNNYADALILDRDGSVRKIEHVEILGPWGESFGRKLLSRLTDAWKIQVRLSDQLPYSLDQIKQVLIDCMGSPQSADALQLEDSAACERLVASVRGAVSAGELVAFMKLPAPEDALDVL